MFNRQKKNLILLKSSVLALFIVLMVSIIAFILIKNKRQKTTEEIVADCASVKTILLDEEIDEMSVQGSVITVLTEVNKRTNEQKIIRINASCGDEIGRINFRIKK